MICRMEQEPAFDHLAPAPTFLLSDGIDPVSEIFPNGYVLPRTLVISTRDLLGLLCCRISGKFSGMVL